MRDAAAQLFVRIARGAVGDPSHPRSLDHAPRAPIHANPLDATHSYVRPCGFQFLKKSVRREKVLAHLLRSYAEGNDATGGNQT